jgi:hypothetical protein
MNPQELKEFINQSYIHSDERSKFIDDFKYDEELSNNKAAVFYNPITEEATITHRGTNATLLDWKNNLAMGLGLYDYTNRAKKAKKTQKEVEDKYGGENLTSIGHSQSGEITRKYGKNSKQIINVNSAYVPSLKYNKPKKNEISIRSQGDIVSLPKLKDDLITSLFYKNRSKNNITIPTSNKFDVLKNHSPNVLDKLVSNIKIGK